MYERLSARAEQVVKAAHNIAREYDQEYVGTEHILLSIARDRGGTGAKILEKHGVTGEALQKQVDQLVVRSSEETWVFGRLPGTPHFRNVVATAIEQARQLESKTVCTEHLLLALLREPGSVAFQALANLGLNHSKARETLLEVITPECGG